MEVEVSCVETMKLKLDSGFELVLDNAFYVSSFRSNLVLVSLLDKIGYSFIINNGRIDLSFNSRVIDSCVLSDGLYRVCLAPNSFDSSFNMEHVGSKRSKIKEKSFLLWHKWLGHIFRKRVDRLIKEEILPLLDF